MTNMTGSKLSIFSHPGKITGYWITIISISARANMGVSGQYGCLFSRCRKYVINSLIHGHFHIGLVITPRPILALDFFSGQYGGLWMITRPIWKCPCINLYLLPVPFPITRTYSRMTMHMSIGLVLWRDINMRIMSMAWSGLSNHPS